ncbi:hypothetical protein PBCV1_a047aL [Paramecium bursaria Chlorella virus 1]|uniref:Uncharacterized protein n=1 Tax=Paramecium bursaria Chlorella virus 1 TaxID=10506 RepID=F8TTW1_PBCV1|nr:hypothetical protein PBCV1_a047aL [Paramecium bursaria Chlorella virus 1]AEI70022.1 hypothetical protein [Paramecium bursaria Chlorella virus 1]
MSEQFFATGQTYSVIMCIISGDMAFVLTRIALETGLLSTRERRERIIEISWFIMLN